MIARIPVAHLHGGEVTEGAFDEAIRHSITKMSHLHFTATEEYRRRVIQLGENPARVFNVGGLGIDNIKRLYSTEFQDKLKSVKNPYGEGGAAEKIKKNLKETDLSNILKKQFYDIEKHQFSDRITG